MILPPKMVSEVVICLYSSISNGHIYICELWKSTILPFTNLSNVQLIFIIPKGLFQLHGSISGWQDPAERTREMERPSQRLTYREKCLLLPHWSNWLARFHRLLLSHSTKFYILLFPSCVTFFKDFHACQLARTPASVFTLAWSKRSCKSEHLLNCNITHCEPGYTSLKFKATQGKWRPFCIQWCLMICLLGYQAF